MVLLNIFKKFRKRPSASTSCIQQNAVPKIFIVDNIFAFKKKICGVYLMECGLEIPAAIYLKDIKTIYVDSSRADRSFPLDAILVHEMVHYLQDINHLKRSCLDIEGQAYSVQYQYQNITPQYPIQYYAENSCRMNGW